MSGPRPCRLCGTPTRPGDLFCSQTCRIAWAILTNPDDVCDFCCERNGLHSVRAARSCAIDLDVQRDLADLESSGA